MLCPILLGAAMTAEAARVTLESVDAARQHVMRPPSTATCIGSRCHWWKSLGGSTTGHCNMASSGSAMQDPALAGV